MAKLILTFDDRELTECAIGPHPVTIGRLPDNMIVIDNPAVSGRHARVYKEGAQFVLEDLKSTNGTFVNDKPIARHTLVEGDTVLVGKHTLTFTQQGADPDAEQTSSAGRGALLDANQQKSLLSGLEHGRPSQVYDAVVPKTAIPTAQGRIGTIKVVAGQASASEFILTAVTTMIGSADTAQIRTRGWFKPKVAAAIARKGDGFTITPMGGKVAVNGQGVDARRELANGDTIDVGGLTLQFTLS